MMLLNNNHRVHGLWIGERLSTLEFLCIQSFTAHGHEFHLWTYEPPAQALPAGVVLRDASSILPATAVFRYRHGNAFGHGKGSLAGFSDLFRYKLLYEEGGWWTDMDICCLRPLDFAAPYVFRTHDVLAVVGNLMKCPPGSPLMRDCYEQALQTLGPDNTDWLLPIRILNQQIVRHGLSDHIRDLSNADRWEIVAHYATQAATLAGEWYAFHWMNEEWRSRGIDKNTVIIGTALDKLLIQYGVTGYQRVAATSNQLQQLISRLKMRLIPAIPQSLRVAIKKLVRPKPVRAKPAASRCYRLAILSNTSWSVYQFRYGLLRSLLERGIEVTIIAPEDEYSHRLMALGCKFVPVNLQKYSLNLLADLPYLRQLKKTLDEHQIDHLITYTIKPNIYGQLAAGSRAIAGLAVVTGLGRLFINPGWKARLAKQLFRYALRSAEQVWFLNQEDQRFFLQHRLINSGQADLLPSEGVDIRRYHKHPLPQRASDQPPPGKPETPIARHDPPFTFLFAGRLMQEKGLYEFIEAARRLRSRQPGTAFWVAGFIEKDMPGAIREEQLQTWMQEGLIHYRGPQEDISPLLQACDAVVLPTYYREGVPRILLEAASVGRPIIATDNVGCREIVIDGINGYLCEKNTPADLCNKMEKLLLLPAAARAAMAAAGRNIVCTQHDEQLVIQRYLTFLGLDEPPDASPAMPSSAVYDLLLR